MRRIGVRELNQQTSKIIARVRRGETVEVADRGKLVARLVPVGGDLSLLEGLVTEGRATPPRDTGAIPMPPVLGDPAVNAAEQLAVAREDERW